MKTLKREEINPVLMSVRNEPLEVIDNGYVYDYVGIGWVKNRIATEVDLINIPTLID